MKIIFAGTPEFAMPALKVFDKQELCAVITIPDRVVGRGRKLKSSPVAVYARDNNLPLYQPEIIGHKFSKELEKVKPDLLVAVAYGKIFRTYFLDVFPYGGLNLHPSLLPQLRGPSPIPAAILQRASETGVTVQKISPEIDSGDILSQVSIRLEGTETTYDLSPLLAEKGALILRDVVNKIKIGNSQSVHQENSLATYCSMISREEGRIDWKKSAYEIESCVRAYNPWPHAFTTWNNKEILILESFVVKEIAVSELQMYPKGAVVGMDKGKGILVNTGQFYLCVTKLQIQGKKPVGWRDFLNGYPNITSARFGL